MIDLRTAVAVLGVLVACSSRSSEPAKGTGSAKSSGPAPGSAAANPGALGTLTFALSEGTPEARAHFARGMLALHSFWYDEALRAFGAAAAADPTLDMAYWGLAMSHLKLLWGEDDVGAAETALRRITSFESLPDRERDWVSAAVALIDAKDVRTSRAQFVAAMEVVHAKHPDDESATFLALAILAKMRPDDPDQNAQRERAVGLASAVFARNPNHPGAAHYIIHAYDTPEHAARALPHARKYAEIAPEAFHARHMPAHIFSRLGMWPEAIKSCEAAWQASEANLTKHEAPASSLDFHSLAWLAEMPFELGRASEAEKWLTLFADHVRRGLPRPLRIQYAVLVESFLARTGQWKRADELLAPLDAPPQDDGGHGAHAHGPAMAGAPPYEHLERLARIETRQRAASMLGDRATTQRLLREGDAVRKEMRPALVASQPPAAVAEIDRSSDRRRRGTLARVAKDGRALLAVLRETQAEVAADTGGESNPSAFIVDEQIADTLLGLGDAKAALAAYDAVTKRHPKRARALLGAARAAAKAGDAATARARYQELLELWSGAEEGTEGLAEARAGIVAPAK